MASLIWFLFPVFYATFTCVASADKLVTLDCQREYHGVYGQDTLLKCLVKSDEENVNILSVTWWRAGHKTPLLMVVNGKVTKLEDPRFAQPQHGSSMDVSFLVKDTKTTDEGEYECELVSDSGADTKVFSLKVTAAYAELAMSAIPEKDIKDGMEIKLFCNASGGYPMGSIQWFEQNGTNLTHSAELECVETADKRLNLFSTVTLRASSGTTQYKCRVLNSNGVNEGEKTLEVSAFHENLSAPEERLGESTTALVAIAVVVGSLASGVLILILLRKRRSRYYAERCDIEMKDSLGLNCEKEPTSENV